MEEIVQSDDNFLNNCEKCMKVIVSKKESRYNEKTVVQEEKMAEHQMASVHFRQDYQKWNWKKERIGVFYESI